MFNILYKGKTIHKNLSYEETTEILDELSEEYYNTGEYDPNEIELEEI
jgi:hypothetical protein